MVVCFKTHEKSANLQQENVTREAERLAKRYLRNIDTRCDREMLVIDITDNKVASKTMETLLFAAAKRGDYETALALLEKGTLLEVESLEGRTPLLIAAQYGRENLIDLFMTYDADIRHLDKDGWSALMLAANDPNAGAVDKLLKYCCYEIINYQNKSFLTALKIATFNKNFSTFFQLILSGAFFNQRGDAEETGLSILLGRIEIVVEERDAAIQVVFKLRETFSHLM